MRRARTLFILIPFTLAACGGGDDPAISVDGAWARTSAAGQTTGAVYFDLEVADDDRLVAASVPTSVAAEAQIHEVVEVTGDEMSGDGMDDEDASGSHDMDEMDETGASDDGEMDMGGAMRMQELVDGLPLQGGETVSFTPGGYHVMLIDLAEPLVTGDEFELTLDFANAGTTTVTVEVAENAP